MSGHVMPTPREPAAPSRALSWPALTALGLAGLSAVAAGALWITYGTAVFFEMIAAGIAACF